MVAMLINAPRGQVPRLGAQKLGDQYAQIAQNCRITAGRLEPLRMPVHVDDLDDQITKTLYQYHQNGTKAFLSWPTVVDVARSPTVNDQHGRIFWTGDGEPRMTTLSRGIKSFAGRLPHAWFVLGVCPPKSAPTVTPTGGVGTVEDRAYRYTFRTPIGEESAPSDPTLASGPVDATWAVAGMDVAPPNSGAITGVVSSSGVADLHVDTVFGLAIGESITVSGTVGLAGLNGSHTIIGIDDGVTKTISIALAAAGAAGAGAWERDAPHNTTGMKKLIYRTVGTASVWLLAGEVDASDATFDDTTGASTNSQITLESEEFDKPPADLHSLVVLPNGCLAGLSGNTLCFSAPYRPHAFPMAYRYTFPSTGVALAAVGNSVIILTDSFPLLSVANSPANAQPTQMGTYAPCVAKRGVVNVGGGALYPSHDGLYLVQPSGAQNFTQRLFRREEWKRLTPSSFVAAFHAGQYLARHENIGSDDSILMLDMSEPDSVIDARYQPDALLSSEQDGELYAVVSGSIYAWNSSDADPMTVLWRSKVFTFPDGPVNFAFGMLRGDFGRRARVLDFTAENASVFASGHLGGAINEDVINVMAVNASRLQTAPPPVDDAAAFSLLDHKGEIVWSKLVRTDQPFSMPSGFLMDAVAVQVSASFSLDSIVVAESMAELDMVPA